MSLFFAKRNFTSNKNKTCLQHILVWLEQLGFDYLSLLVARLQIDTKMKTNNDSLLKSHG